MKDRTKILAIALACIVIMGVGAHFFRIPFLGIHPAEAIPRHSAFVLAFNQLTLENLLSKEDHNGLARLFVPEVLQSDLKEFEKILAGDLSFSKEKDLLAVIQPTRVSGFDVLFIMDDVRDKDLERSLKKKKNWRVRKSIFRNSEVFTLQAGKDQLAIAKYRNLLLFARHAYLVENALSQVKSPSTSLCRDDGFKQNYKRCEAEPDNLHVLLNLSQIGAGFAPLIEPARLQIMVGLGQVGDWTHLVLPCTNNSPEWKGTFSANNQQNMLAANAKGPELPYKNFFRVLPDNIGLFWWLSVGNIHPKNQGGDWRKYFSPWVGKDVAFALGEQMENNTIEQFLLIKTKDARKTETLIDGYAGKAGKLESFDFQMFKIQQWMGTGLSEMLGMDSLLNNPYGCVLGEYLLVSNSRAGLERWLGKYLAGQTYSKHVAFLQSIRTLPVEAHGFFYLENIKAWQQLSLLFTSDFLTKIGGNPMKFSHLAATLHRKGGLCELTAITPASGRSTEAHPANILWNVLLSGETAITPKVFQNPQSGEMEIFIQDKTGQLYLVSRSGRILQRRSLDEPIFSDVFQVDLHNSGESQFAFSTRNGIYILDEDLMELAGFPLRLQTPATNGVAVVDFFTSHDYQFFIACENGNAYGFDEKGSPVEGWRPKTNVGIVRHPLVHFQSQGMDFMILMDETGRMQVFQKNGTDRFQAKKFNGIFPQAPDYQSSNEGSRIVACDENGRIFVTNLRGEDFRLNLKTSDKIPVKFVFADVTGDERKDYVALNDNIVAAYFYEGSTFKKGFEFKFEQSQDEIFPVYWKGRDKAFIGTFNKEKKQIFLVDGTGRLLPQFPLEGTTSFKVVDLLGNGKPVVITGNGEYLYAYAIE